MTYTIKNTDCEVREVLRRLAEAEAVLEMHEFRQIAGDR